ncbi:carbonic anhydrase [Phenylobacterium deserti]|uniref:Carbonic anhydrase n=2 Tax=Phenylobacterium deserti TaxID=1914756 RepID=A0A328AR27_9CAUL|nr:carbonic anhydrase [Phenylobacterium deserti]
MEHVLERATLFRDQVFPSQSALYKRLASDGQNPRALMISCADSRVVPEQITQAAPGDLFVCRNAGNIVPPFSQANGGVSSAVEYAVVALGVRDIVVCGHSDCGAMKAFSNPAALEKMPNVAAWLRHAHAAHSVVCSAYHGLDEKAAARATALENVVVQIQHLRTHPSVASAMARGELTLHGWFFEIETGNILALDGETGRFVQVTEGASLPVAVPAAPRLAAADQFRIAAE